METIVVEYNGAMRQVTLDQLSALVRRGFVSPDARAIVDGEDCLVRDVVQSARGSSTSPPPTARAPGFPPPSREASTAVMPIPTVAGGPVSAAEVKESDAMIAFKERATAPGREDSKDVKSPALIIVAVSCVLVLTIAVITAVYVARPGNDVRDAEPSVASAQADVGDWEAEEEYAGEEAADEFATVANDSASEAAEDSEEIDEDASDGLESSEIEVAEEKDWNAPFDDTVEVLPPGFQGCDFEKLYEALATLRIRKDEYETTQEFENRVEELKKNEQLELFFGTITPTSRVAVNVERYYEQGYDADSRTLFFQFFSLVGQSNGLNVHDLDELGRTYSYGVVSDSEVEREYRLNLSPERARELRNRIKILMVFTIDFRKERYLSNYVATEEFVTSISQYRGVYGKDVEVWFYDEKTGEVVLKTPVHKGALPTFVANEGVEVDLRSASARTRDGTVENFDLTVTQIDPDYQGVDLNELSKLLSQFWSALDKNEYETAAEYRTRRREFLNNFANEPLVGDAKAGDWFAYVLSSRRSEIEQEYYAEKKALTWRLEGASFAKNQHKGSCLIATEPGVPNIVAADGASCYVANDHELLEEDGLFFVYPCSPTEASDLRGHVDALVLFTIDDATYAKFEPDKAFPPIDITFGRYRSDEQDYPCSTFKDFDDHVLGARVYVKGLQVWFYDNRTGDVLKKYAVANAKSGKEKGKGATGISM